MDTLVNIILAIFHSKRVSNDCRKTKTNAITPITTGANRAMNESEFQAITCNLLKAREKSRVMKKNGEILLSQSQNVTIAIAS